MSAGEAQRAPRASTRWLHARPLAPLTRPARPPRSPIPSFSCNTEMVGLFKVSESAADSAELRGYVEAHAAKTGSHRAQQLLADWDNAAPKFVKVRKERPAHAPHRAPRTRRSRLC